MNTIAKSLITGIKPTKSSKIQLEVAENKNGVNALSLFNASDDRFTTSMRKAWLSAEPADAKKYFPDLAADIDKAANGEIVDYTAEGAEKEVNAVMSNGLELRVEIKEATTPLDDYQKENISRSVKQNPTNGTVLFFQGQPIFSKTDVIIGEPNDERLQHDSEMPLVEFEAQLAKATNATATAVNAEQVS